MIALLRAGALALNAVTVIGTSALLGLGWVGAFGIAGGFFLVLWWACGLAPRGAKAGPEIAADAERAARRLGAPGPVAVCVVGGWTAAAVRGGRGGYVLLVGSEVRPEHREALFAHEIAHVVGGDLAWEPFTDGPARLLLPAVRRLPPLGLAVFPFFLLGAPLARRTELRADALASRFVPTYASVMKEVMRSERLPVSLLYPAPSERLRASARDS